MSRVFIPKPLELPKGEFKEIDLLHSNYIDSDGKNYSSEARKVFYSNLIHVPYYDYQQITEAAPEGYRYSRLEETRFLAQEEARLKKEGRSVKEAVKHSIFSELDFVYKMLTHYAIRGIDGNKIGHYIDKDPKGRPYARINLFSDEELAAEGIKFPVAEGLAIVEWNPVLGIPVAVSSSEPEFGRDDKEDHTMHLWLDLEKKEVAIRLTKHFCHLGSDCYDFDAQNVRSMPKTKYITSDVYVRLVEKDTPNSEKVTT